MFCDNCGRELNENARFCPKCGQKVVELSESETDKGNKEISSQQLSYNAELLAEKELSISEKNSRNKNTKIFIALLSVLVVATVIGYVAYYNSPQNRYTRQMEIGNRYLEECDYEKAIAAFNNALEIYPDDKDAKELIEETYIGWSQQLFEDGKSDDALVKLDEARDSVGDRNNVISLIEDILGKEIDTYIEAEDFDAADSVISELEKFNTDKGKEYKDIIYQKKEAKKTYFERLFSRGPHIAYDENDRAGYINIKGDYVIQPVFLEGKSFSCDYAAVKDPGTGLWGYINIDGEYVIEPRYKRASTFCEDAAVVEGENGLGIIDKTGNYIIEPKYQYVSNFKEGYAIVEQPDSKLFTFVDKHGMYKFGDFKEVFLFCEGKAAVKDMSGKWVILHDNGEIEDFPVEIDSFRSYTQYKNENMGGMLSSYIDFKYSYKAKTIYGENVVVNDKGEVTYELLGRDNEYDYFGGFSGDYAPVSIIVNNHRMYGMIDKNYNWVIEPKYDYIYANGNGYAIVKEEIDYSHVYSYVIDMAGNIIIDENERNGIIIDLGLLEIDGGYIYCHDGFQTLPIPARNVNTDKYGYCDRYYNELIHCDFDEVKAFSYDGSYAIVKYNGLLGMIDKEGNWLIEPRFSCLSYKEHYW